MAEDFRPGFLGVHDYLSLPRDASTWLLNPLIPLSGAGLIYSPAKTGKSAIALQLGHAIAGGADDWMGFPIGKHGRVLFLQVDTPRSTWALRLQAFERHGYTFNDDLMKIADRETLAHFPFDILQPTHAAYLTAIIRQHMPVVAVIIDTLRKIHTGNENDSTAMSNVMSSLIKACHPAAVIIISHDRKPSLDVEKDIMADHRGSTSVVGEMDGIMRLTKSRLYYAGRNIEEGNIKILRKDVGDTLIWMPDPDEHKDAIASVLADTAIPSMRRKARALAPLISKSEEACMSILRRQGLRLVDKIELI